MSRALSGKRLVVASVIFTVGFVGSFVYDEFSAPGNPPSAIESPVALAPVPEPLVETDIAHVRGVLGPFETIAVSSGTPTPETRAPAVLVLNEDGSTEASTAWTVPFDTTSWTKQDAFLISSLSVRLGFVTVGVGFDRVFVVKANQPFVLAAQPNNVIVVDVQGNTWQTTTARAEALRQPI